MESEGCKYKIHDDRIREKKMRILIVSDTHGRHDKFEKALEKAGKIDLMIHLGDIQDEEDYMENASGCPVCMVAGNNDYFSDLPYERTEVIGGKKMFLTHGHSYAVHSGLRRLAEEGKRHQAEVVLFGHTHVPCVEEQEVILFVNPGSLTYPRQEGHKPSYAIMGISDSGEIRVNIEYSM